MGVIHPCRNNHPTFSLVTVIRVSRQRADSLHSTEAGEGESGVRCYFFKDLLWADDDSTPTVEEIIALRTANQGNNATDNCEIWPVIVACDILEWRHRRKTQLKFSGSP